MNDYPEDTIDQSANDRALVPYGLELAAGSFAIWPIQYYREDRNRKDHPVADYLLDDRPLAQRIWESLPPDLIKEVLCEDDGLRNLQFSNNHAGFLEKLTYAAVDCPLSIDGFGGYPEISPKADYCLRCDCGGGLRLPSYHDRSVYNCMSCGARVIFAPTIDKDGIPLTAREGWPKVPSFRPLWDRLMPEAKKRQVKGPNIHALLFLSSKPGNYDFSSIQEYNRYWRVLPSRFNPERIKPRVTIRAIVKGQHKYNIIRYLAEHVPGATGYNVQQRFWFSLVFCSASAGWQLLDGRMLDPVLADNASVDTEWATRTSGHDEDKR